MKITERGQLTIPKTLRDRYGFGPSVDVEVVAVEAGLLIKKRARGRDPISKWRGVLKTPLDVDAYIEEVRGR